MVKVPTKWASQDGSSTAVASGSGYILQESGFKILLETGNGTGSLLVEDSIMTPKNPTAWSEQ